MSDAGCRMSEPESRDKCAAGRPFRAAPFFFGAPEGGFSRGRRRGGRSRIRHRRRRFRALLVSCTTAPRVGRCRRGRRGSPRRVVAPSVSLLWYGCDATRLERIDQDENAPSAHAPEGGITSKPVETG